MFLSDLNFKLKWSAAYRKARDVSKVFKPNLICGFEVGGAVPAARLASDLKVPFFTKYMGTIVYPYIKENQLYKVKPYLKGLSVGANLHFMHNDGTKGDKVLQYLGVNKKSIRFTIDGVDKQKFKHLLNSSACRKN